MGGLTIGDMAPDFSLEGPDGSFRLSDHRGERVVLLFYPGDDTTVCTKQFCSYRDAGDAMAELDATIVGISTQDGASKAAFKAKHRLTTQLLADSDAAVSSAYGVYAKRLKIAKRTVFVVDEDGRVAHRHANFVSLSFDDVEDLRAALANLPPKTGP
jgi:thioredoxin-dependent peroxiredoxin